MKPGDKVVALQALNAGIGEVSVGTFGVIVSAERVGVRDSFLPAAAVKFPGLSGRGVMIVPRKTIRVLSALELLAMEAE